jgi:hypothetical protein
MATNLNVEQATAMVGLVRAAVTTRRPQLLHAVGCLTQNEYQLVDIVSLLLDEVMDWEDYNRRVDFTMKCIEGDLLGQMRKCKAVRQGEASDGQGFVPALDCVFPDAEDE